MRDAGRTAPSRPGRSSDLRSLSARRLRGSLLRARVRKARAPLDRFMKVCLCTPSCLIASPPGILPARSQSENVGLEAQPGDARYADKLIRSHDDADLLDGASDLRDQPAVHDRAAAAAPGWRPLGQRRGGRPIVNVFALTYALTSPILTALTRASTGAVCSSSR